jgi:hypothetical protein
VFRLAPTKGSRAAHFNLASFYAAAGHGGLGLSRGQATFFRLAADTGMRRRRRELYKISNPRLVKRMGFPMPPVIDGDGRSRFRAPLTYGRELTRPERKGKPQ